jgi:hypothetical protein
MIKNKKKLNHSYVWWILSYNCCGISLKVVILTFRHFGKKNKKTKKDEKTKMLQPIGNEVLEPMSYGYLEIVCLNRNIHFPSLSHFFL